MRGKPRALIIFCLFLILAGCLSVDGGKDTGTQFLTNVPVSGETPTESIHGDKPKEASLSAPLNVVTEELEYYEGALGFLVKPSAPGDYPGVIMIHEWWGLNDNIRNEAIRLAGEGYVVLAVDLFNKKFALTPEEARTLVGSFDQEAGIANMLAAKAHLKDVEDVTGVAILGWCFGGGQSLQASLNSEDLSATVSHGDLLRAPCN
jgi:carboxymethylenebutenolidase